MRKINILIFALLFCKVIFGQSVGYKNQIEKILEGKKATVGLALYNFSNEETLLINGDMRFPMMSVFKFHIALNVLSEVDKGRWSLDEEILVKKSDLHANTWSPLREKYPEGGVKLPLSEILEYTVSLSDNNTCDMLIEMVGGAGSVNSYIHSKGIEDVNIGRTEQQMKRSWEEKSINWTTPKAMLELLKQFNNKQLLKPQTHAFMWETMVNTSTGSIRNNLPKDAVVAHKTGASGYNSDGVSIATNDVGIVVLPNGNRVAFVIFITNSTESSEVNYAIISDIAEVLYCFD